MPPYIKDLPINHIVTTMSLLSFISAEIWRNYAGWAFVFAALTVLEWAFGRQRQDITSRVSGLGFWIIAIPVSVVILRGLEFGWQAIGVRPLLSLPVFGYLSWTGPLAAIIATLVGAAIGDFFGYWYHRIQHKWLWPIHAVHHSVTDLNAVNSYHHISDAFTGALVVALPTSLIVADTGPAIVVLSMLLWLQPAFLHSPTKFSFGIGRAIFADNVYHRIHHSVEPQHFDKNFGVLFTLWDRIFGTAYFPRKDEWPDVGLSGVQQPKSVKEWLDLPFRWLRSNDLEPPPITKAANSPAASGIG